MTDHALPDIFDLANTLETWGAETSARASGRDFTARLDDGDLSGPVTGFSADVFEFSPPAPAMDHGPTGPTATAGTTVEFAKPEGAGGGGKPDKGDGGDPPPPPPPPLPATDTYTSGQADDGINDYFNIEIIFEGDQWTGNLQEAFIAAADYFSSIIATGLADQTFTYGVDGVTGLEGIFQPVTPYSKDGDDLVIEAHLLTIDGVGGIAGGASPYAVLTDTGSLTFDDPTATYAQLPTASLMLFDLADASSLLSNGTWDDVVFHEMMHALGFGSLWGEATTAEFDWDLVDGTLQTDNNGTNKPTDDTQYYDYTGTEGLLAAGSDVRVEGQFGAGTAGTHWDEISYDNEIMSGIVNGSSYVAPFTIAALADLGYDLVGSDYAGMAADAEAVLIA